jgi:PIN domain nuclease of toxin-antitoxin system
MLALLNLEPGGDVVQNFLDDDNIVYAHALNLVEVFYDVSRDHDVLVARATIRKLQSGGVILRADMDVALWEDAAQLKADWKRVSLADCFGVALARRLNADFITADRHELEMLDKAGLARFTFIR